MKNIGNKLLGDPSHVTFDKRVFHLAILMGTAMSLSGILINLYFGNSFVTDLIFAGGWIISYYLFPLQGLF